MSRLDLGVGIVALGHIDLLWNDIADLVDVIEVEPQTLWAEVDGGWAPDEAAYDWIASTGKPVLAHGVGFPVGGQTQPDRAGVVAFHESVGQLRAVHASEHLAFNRVGERHAGFLLPPRQTWATVEAAVAHIDQYQRGLDVPFLVENAVSYVRPSSDEMSDGEFLSAVATRSGCGLLLDLHNLLANERNGRGRVLDVVDELIAGGVADRVLEVHVAAGFWFRGRWLDAHSGPCEPEMLSLLARVLRHLPCVRAVIFEAQPSSLYEMSATGVRTQLVQLQEIVAAARRVRPVRTARTPARTRPHDASTPALELTRQEAMLGYTTRALAQRPEDDDGYDVLRELTDQARLSRVAIGAESTVRQIASECGVDGLDQVAASYLTACDAAHWTMSEARAFERFVSELSRRPAAVDDQRLSDDVRAGV